MRILEKALSESVWLLESDKFLDERGYLIESFNRNTLKKIGLNQEFVQDNVSVSHKGVLRGIHFQVRPYEQAKLIRILSGEVFDVAVDLRKGSRTFGQNFGAILSEENARSLWLPEGFGHGFEVISEKATMLYKMTNFYQKTCTKTLIWNDPMVNIKWHLKKHVISKRDKQGSLLRELASDL